MKVYNWKIKDKKLNIEPSAAAIGNFDGVHLGHKKVLEEAKKISTEKKLPISVLTFEPHPREFFSSEKNNFSPPVTQLSAVDIIDSTSVVPDLGIPTIKIIPLPLSEDI